VNLAAHTVADKKLEYNNDMVTNEHLIQWAKHRCASENSSPEYQLFAEITARYEASLEMLDIVSRHCLMFSNDRKIFMENLIIWAKKYNNIPDA